MTTTTAAPAGFTITTERDPHTGHDDQHVDGPSAGGVTTFWTEDRGVTLAVDGYDRHSSGQAIDLTPESARRLWPI